MRQKLLKIITMIGLCVTMLSGCTARTPVIATVNTEETERVAETEDETGTGSKEPTSEDAAGEERSSEEENTTETETGTGEETTSESGTGGENTLPTGSEERTEATTEEQTEAPTVEPTEPKPTVPPYLLKVDRNANCVTVYGRDDSGAYTVPVKYMICSVGTGQRTPTGVFMISDQYRWRALFSNTYGQYASRITGHILFHSVPYLLQSPDTLVPGTYNELGTKASLGCVRLICSDAKWIYDNCPPGTTVEIFDGPTTSVPEKPSALQIDPNSPYSGWDPTDPHPSNPWKTVPITINGVVDLTVECGDEVDLISHVSALDIDGRSLLPVSVSGEVDINACGTYIVKYSAVGAIGTTVTVNATVTVVPKPETEASTESETEESTEESSVAEEEITTEEDSMTEELPEESSESTEAEVEDREQSTEEITDRENETP